MAAKHENVKWVDGLRGLASFTVVLTHIARAFDPDLFNPSPGPDMRPRILQYPIIRVLPQGRIGVAIFSLVTGYVCALKPIRQIRSSNSPAAFRSISQSAFRRIPRLVLPTTIATIMAWFLCQFGVFHQARRCDSWWISVTSPEITPFFGEAVKSLLLNLITTWTRSWNIYDGNQWTLLPLLKGAMLIYIAIIGTAGMKTAFGMQFFFGAFLSDLSQHPPHIHWLSHHPSLAYTLSPILILSGLYLASYPEGKPELASWSNSLHSLSTYIFPSEPDVPRFYTGVGLDLIALGIHFSPQVKTALSNRHLLWLGKNSFAVYLIHGTLMRTLLIWILYGVKVPEDGKDEKGEVVRGVMRMCGRWRWYPGIAVWLVLLYVCADAWTRWVDPWCGRVTKRLERYVFEEDSGMASPGGSGSGSGSGGVGLGGGEKRLLG
ncbi:acyltransferase family protein [Rutstroemia sp. NJR-2017a WRK4]|nr:acyltransferase family protein [Rutstroemia sp. NJR-2017a WRK4]